MIQGINQGLLTVINIIILYLFDDNQDLDSVNEKFTWILASGIPSLSESSSLVKMSGYLGKYFLIM